MKDSQTGLVFSLEDSTLKTIQYSFKAQMYFRSGGMTNILKSPNLGEKETKLKTSFCASY